MLRSLYIQNYALIEKLDIDFGSGFSVITGETGAGKSIILGAIGLLLGQRADVKSIRRGAAKCVIEARFEIAGYGMQPFFEENELEYEDECILRREVYASGKSRAFINDTPASLVQMKELGEQLIDVHSQHQNLLLNKEGFQLSVLDLLAHDEDELSKYRSLHREWKQVQQDLEHLVALAERTRRTKITSVSVGAVGGCASGYRRTGGTGAGSRYAEPCRRDKSRTVPCRSGDELR